MNTQVDLIRADLQKIAPYNAGLTVEEVHRRYGVDNIAKLGSNENPLGPTPNVAAMWSDLVRVAGLYPDPRGTELVARLADIHGVEPGQIILGNGSEDLIAVLCRSVIRPGDRVVTLYPSFPLHEDYAVLMGGTVQRVEVGQDLEIDVPAFLDAIASAPRMVIFSNPMNPVGCWVDPAGMSAIVASQSEQTLLVVDEAYAEYAAGEDYPETVEMLRNSKNRNWVVLRTFSKAFGLAGFRIGYGIIGDPTLTDYFHRARTPFNTNAIAQAAALIALADRDHLQQSVELAQSERARVAATLKALGFRVAASKGNFLFVDAQRDAVQASETLMTQGVIVKPWKQQGFTTFIRVSVGGIQDNDKFLAAARLLVPETPHTFS